MRLSLIGVVLLVAAAFLLGRATSPAAAPAATRGHVYTGRMGDVIRVPAAATRCLVSEEGGAANLICGHTPTAKARFSVVFFTDNLFVYRTAQPDNPVFTALGKP